MRRRLLLMGAWPALSQRFGLHPWDVGRLTPDELNVYIKAVSDG